MEKQAQKLIVDINQLSAIMEAFYVVTNIKSTLYDTSFQEVLTYPRESCSFCKMVKAHHADLCYRCDMNAFAACAKEQKTISYRCHVGLFEVISPLRNGQEIIGYIMFGQMMQKEFREHTIKAIVSKYAYLSDAEVLSDALEEIVNKSMPEINAATLLMQSCICYLLSNRIVQLNRVNFTDELNNYIYEHISEDITVSRLCRHFGMSRSGFYTLAKQCLPCSLSQHIRSCRIEKAKMLLQNSSLSITEISAQVGFLDYNYFLRIFKKETGLPCRQYRNTHT